MREQQILRLKEVLIRKQELNSTQDHSSVRSQPEVPRVSEVQTIKQVPKVPYVPAAVPADNFQRKLLVSEGKFSAEEITSFLSVNARGDVKEACTKF